MRPLPLACVTGSDLWTAKLHCTCTALTTSAPAIKFCLPPLPLFCLPAPCLPAIVPPSAHACACLLPAAAPFNSVKNKLDEDDSQAGTHHGEHGMIFFFARLNNKHSKTTRMRHVWWCLVGVSAFSERPLPTYYLLPLLLFFFLYVPCAPFTHTHTLPMPVERRWAAGTSPSHLMTWSGCLTHFKGRRSELVSHLGWWWFIVLVRARGAWHGLKKLSSILCETQTGSFPNVSNTSHCSHVPSPLSLSLLSLKKKGAFKIFLRMEGLFTYLPPLPPPSCLPPTTHLLSLIHFV